MATATEKIKISELSKSIGQTNKAVLEALASELGITGKTHSSNIDVSDAKKIEAFFNKGQASPEAKTPAKKPAEKAEAPKAKAAPEAPKAEAPKAEPVKAVVPAPKVEPKPAAAAPKPIETPVAQAPAAAPTQPKAAPAPTVAAKPAVQQPAPLPVEQPVAKAKKGKQDNEPAEEEIKIVTILEPLTVADLAKKLEMRDLELIKHLFMKGVMVTINQTLQVDDALKVAEELGFIGEGPSKQKAVEGTPELKIKETKGSKFERRAPVVSILGHVDHGKTSLLDAIRESRHKIVDTEAGGITQKIGAYTVFKDDQKIVFIDTPGHAAFTAMRLRGARATDIAIIVVAADDGVMPQTIEAINHARLANVPIIIAVNKIDKPDADPDRVLVQLTEHGVNVEKWGGDTLHVEVSAIQKLGLDDLLDQILLISELQELKADATLNAEGVVIESWLDKGKGPVATVLVQSGTLRIGDNVLIGAKGGRVRALISDSGETIKEAGPSTPVEILGLNAVPEAGEPFEVLEDEKEFKTRLNQAQMDEREGRINRLAAQAASLTALQDQNRKDFYLIIKGDTQGSVEAVTASILQLATDEIPIHVIHAATGDISEADILLASANQAVIICFNSGVESTALKSAEKHGIKIRHHNIIYHLMEEVEKMMLGMLSPDELEVEIGTIEVRQLFSINNNTIAGCYVTDGKVVRNAIARVFRGKELIYEGQLAQLKRFKEDAKEVAQGYECGISFYKFNDLKAGDIIKVFEMKSVERTSLV